MEIKSLLKSVTDRPKWAARGVSFVAKAKATKMVWFPPKPVEAGTGAASAAEKGSKQTITQAAGAGEKVTKPVPHDDDVKQREA
jgi:hypothetical protein